MVKANYDKLREKGAKKKKLSQASAKKQKALRISKVEVHAKMEHNKAIANMKEQMQKKHEEGSDAEGVSREVFERKNRESICY